ncbi:LysR family transcriptional regulator [Neorhizobium lilium]|uniref:HTH-type transcriptional regulator TtuA n=1 Tax=Neorhizobium lilium TaxID=2503024 RepID=A0A3S3RLS9_9HYPH|nr:LysR family transcriptional regulator [Neorhizobium lilium]RWX81596.1 LysR family transcriptional regulator [Neorhizobium lilium]
MLDGLQLDHLRTFVAAVDEGSFSAAGRKIGRAQSVVSQAIANLEGQLGLSLFERIGRYPELTPAGRGLLASARQIVRDSDTLKASARRLSEGLEPFLSIVIDVMFPQALLTEVVGDFAVQFPTTPLRLHVEALGAVAELVVNGRCSAGVMGTYPLIPPSLTSERLFAVEMATVVAPGHPLARWQGPIPLELAEAETQLVLTDRSELTRGIDLGVQSKNTWRLSDLGAKQSFLVAGLGWGHMPLPMVASDLAEGRLVQIKLEGPGPGILPMRAIYKADAMPGPAGRWLLDRIGAAGSGSS